MEIKVLADVAIELNRLPGLQATVVYPGFISVDCPSGHRILFGQEDWSGEIYLDHKTQERGDQPTATFELVTDTSNPRVIASLIKYLAEYYAGHPVDLTGMVILREL